MTTGERLFVGEVVRLHEVIEGWTTGRLPETDAAFAGFADALGPDFIIINPEGSIETREHVVPPGSVSGMARGGRLSGSSSTTPRCG